MQVLGDRPTTFTWRGPGLLLPDEPCSFLVRLKADRAAFPEHDGYLSLKFVLSGLERFTRDRRSVTVNDRHYFVLNHGQRYSSEVVEETGAESIAVFFDPGQAADVLSTLVLPADRILDPPKLSSQPVCFYDRLYPIDPVLTRQLNAVRTMLASDSAGPDRLSEWFASVMERLVAVHRGLRTEVNAIDAVRPATRAEIYRRLCWGRDYIESCYAEAVTLAGAADAACLSRYRFLRLFRQAFGVTPHAYLTDRRLRAAQRMLRQTDLPVTRICLDVGFESHGSFSTLFRRRFGRSPSEWRRAECGRADSGNIR